MEERWALGTMLAIIATSGLDFGGIDGTVATLAKVRTTIEAESGAPPRCSAARASLVSHRLCE